MGAVVTSPSRTTGRGAIRPTLRIATSGWFTIGVWKRPATFPALVTVKVEPRSSSGARLPARAASARRDTSAASSSTERESQHERRRARLLRPSGRLWSGLRTWLVAVRLAADDDEHGPNGHDLALLDEDARDGAGRG